jgi:CII-binding regulator of phage lambda lysogenization HflD
MEMSYEILTNQIPNDLEEALTLQAQRLNKSPEDVVLELLSRQLPALSQPQAEAQTEDDPLLQLLGSIYLEGISDLGENHDHYIGQALYQELNPDA